MHRYERIGCSITCINTDKTSSKHPGVQSIDHKADIVIGYYESFKNLVIAKQPCFSERLFSARAEHVSGGEKLTESLLG